MKQNSKIKIVFVGHVDHGKSTLIGRLLYDTHSIPEDKLADLVKKTDSENGSLDFSYVMDHFEEERKQGITIDTAQTFFKTDKREYVIIDAPGHVEFIMNMMTGASQADAAILLVDAFEGIQEQTRRHAFILSLLGIKQVIAAVNKMDLVNYDESKYNVIVEELGDFLSSLKIQLVNSVPISSVYGDNIITRPEKMKWYKGKTFVETIDSLSSETDAEVSYAVLAVQDVYNTKENDRNKRISVGRVEAGALYNNSTVYILPSDQRAQIKSIEDFTGHKDICVKGECVGICFDKPVFVERGNVICTDKDELLVADEFEATLFWLGKNSMKVGSRLLLKCSTQEVPCYVDEIYSKSNSSTMEIIYDNMDTLYKYEIGQVVIKAKVPVVLCTTLNIPAFRHFVIMHDNSIAAGGIVTGSL